ncbi:hypothetical protein COMA2_80159 [Candidatus Nitrospira nitrificans]|uniref:Uncharacterized protein n=1 Tax=Candidatus Nitrospira nitrificans TaxID=1742973 RepID=A0A0S4LR43_9BACT|nr:hypothetical protein COMA2_80159 [Candidatus Nitrospira nitrificans]
MSSAGNVTGLSRSVFLSTRSHLAITTSKQVFPKIDSTRLPLIKAEINTYAKTRGVHRYRATLT